MPVGMPVRMRVRILLAALAAMTAAAGADISGTWSAQVPQRNKTIQDVTFRFEQKGTVVTGKLYGDTVDLPISQGTLEGDTLRFVINTEGYSGKTQFLYTGKLVDGSIQLTRERDDSSTRSDPEARKKSAVEFTLKKML